MKERRILRIFCLGLIIVSFTGCRTKEVLLPSETKTETKYIDRLQTQKEYVHDSIYITTKGDTVYYTKYRTKTVNTGRDSISYIYKTDTIVKPVIQPSPATTTNKLTKWQQFRIGFGDGMLLIAIGAIIYCFRSPLKNLLIKMFNLIKKLI